MSSRSSCHTGYCGLQKTESSALGYPDMLIPIKQLGVLYNRGWEEQHGGGPAAAD